MNIRLNEVFRSVQGEGPHQGRPAFFVRLQGCTRKCSFCFGILPYRRKPKVAYSRGVTKYIDEVRVGDKLLAFDENQKVVETTVMEVFNRTVEEFYEIRLENPRREFIFVTPEHPFLTNNGWIQAKDLQADDEIMHIDFRQKISFRKLTNNPMKRPEVGTGGRKEWDEKIGLVLKNGVRVVSIQRKTRLLQVYNFRCWPYHTYFVDWLAVHNCDTQQSQDWDAGYEVDKAGILEDIKRSLYEGVVITGGEPFALKRKEWFVSFLSDVVLMRKPFVDVETNGDELEHYKDLLYGIRQGLTVVWSPKQKGILEKLGTENLGWIFPNLVVKILIDINESADDSLDYFGFDRAFRSSVPLWLQPTTTKELDHDRKTLDWCIQEAVKIGANVSARIHYFGYAR